MPSGCVAARPQTAPDGTARAWRSPSSLLLAAVAAIVVGMVAAAAAPTRSRPPPVAQTGGKLAERLDGLADGAGETPSSALRPIP